jgi:ribonuclease J
MLTITVHRGTQQIGGSCIEIEHGSGQRLVLDAGRPLDASRNARDLLPATLDKQRPATVLFSHAHMDHWGLIDELPSHWPIWSGEIAAELMRLSTELFGGKLDRKFATWHSRSGTFKIGDFTITPFLTDHSAPDAYMLLIEGDGQRVLYTGDFRVHGRKASLVERMIEAPPAGIDVLLMEGTNLGSDKPVITEAKLEAEFVKLAYKTPRHIFVQWSAQNIDRTVTLYRAAKRTGRKLVVDLYGADVLRRISAGTRIPTPGPDFPSLQVLILSSGKRLYARQGRHNLVQEMVDMGVATSRKKLVASPSIIMLRDAMLREFAEQGLGFTPNDAYAFSNWSGYIDPNSSDSGWAKAEAGGSTRLKLHTSGHASPRDLERFAAAIAPRYLVPVHGVAWDVPAIHLPPVQRLADGEPWPIVYDGMC